MERKRLRVDGIPNDIPVERAKDKLTIHFLRTRNGGGEVEEIEMIPGPPLHAIVTFEDDEVVESVLEKKHFLDVKDKMYSLHVSKVPGTLELDEVFQKSSVTVNCKILPKTHKHILKSLMKTYKEVIFHFDENSKTCKISGSYTAIQTLSQELIRKLDIGHAGLSGDPSSGINEKTGVQPHKKKCPDFPQVEDYTSLPYNGAEQANYYAKSESFGEVKESLSQEFMEKWQIGHKSLKEDLSSAKTDPSLFKKLSEASAVSFQEQFVWDSDIFRYMKQFYSSKYQDILKKYNVKAVDESSDEITIIYLQADKNNRSDLRSAQMKLMELYQDLELSLRKEQIDKRDLNVDKDLKNKLRDLQILFPQLLFHEDEKYIFLIGGSSDVALGKQNICSVQLNPTRYQGTSLSGHQMSTVGDKQRDFASPLYKFDHYESRGSRIAASFNLPIDSSSKSKTGLDEKYLASSSIISADKKHPFDYERSLGSDNSPRKALGFPSKIDESNGSQADEKSESKISAPIKKLSVVPVLKTGREDIRLGKNNMKSAGPLKPVRITKVSSEFPCSSLVDIGPTSLDFKLSEPKLRRTNSLPRFHSKENSSPDHPDGTFKDCIFAEDWVWHFMKEFYKSQIDACCSEVQLTEENEKSSEIAVLNLKALSKSKLLITKQSIQKLHQEIRMKVSRSFLRYSDLGVSGSDHTAVEKWCRPFYSVSSELCIMLKNDMLLLIYPTDLKQTVHSLIGEITKSPEYLSLTSSMQNYNQLFAVNNSNQQEDIKTTSDEIIPEVSVYLSERKDLKSPEDSVPLVDKTKVFISVPEDPGTSLVSGIDKPFFSSLVPPLQEKMDPGSQPHEPKQKGFKFFEDPDCLNSNEKHKADLSTSSNPVHDFKSEQTTNDYDRPIFILSSDQKVDPLPSIPNAEDKTYQWQEKNENILNRFENLRSPAVGQESEIFNGVCGQCKSNGKINILSCGHLFCDNCYSASIDSCCICCDNTLPRKRNTLQATMSHISMSLRLKGYERNTSRKIKYEVPDGEQGAEDPHPGKPYRGGTFEAYLPDNPEGMKLIILYEKALKQGLTFHIKERETGDIVAWHRVPHKTSPDGGKAKNGYPDSTYIKNTIALLKELGIE